MRRGVSGFTACALTVIALPWVITNDFYLNMASQILIYALLAVSLNILLGYGGMVSLGHAAYLGITAYTCVIVAGAGYGHLAAACAGVVLSTAAAALFGVLALRASGLGFLMITLALGQIVWGITYRWNARRSARRCAARATSRGACACSATMSGWYVGSPS
jgi:branched-chain amino acid transport system permease protein